MLHTPLPDISPQCLSRQFVLDLPNIEITSLDITSHGCYILAGCSNGMVVLYDMTSNDENGTLVGQIRAKGMHTNLLVTVKFSPDNRFGFAGVMKGSMEMLAVDVGQIPVWHDSALVGGRPAPKTIGRKTKGIASIDQLGLRSMSKAAPLVCTYSHLDPKLRGFGAVTRLRCEEEKYLLICGRGIKNVHVWLFSPSSKADVPPKWTCLYDVTTNGVSIEALGFRERLVSSTYRLEMVSKSSGMGIRVWDLSHFDEESNLSSNKIPYEDIPTSNDCRTFSENGEMAFGGTYDFSTLKIDSAKDSLRETFEVPSPTLEDDNGQRRRRHMRQIQDVLTTQDGQHALAICTDGGVLYYHHSYFHEIDTDGSLVELQSLIREIEVGPQFMTDGAWTLKRVGRRGAVVLVRSCRNVVKTRKGEDQDEDSCRGSVVELSLLSDLVPDDVPDTSVSLKAANLSSASETIASPALLPETLPWTKWNCFFHDPSPTADWDNQMNSLASSCLSPSHSSHSSLFDDSMSECSERSLSVAALPLPLPPTRGRPPSGKNKSLKPPQPQSQSQPSSATLPLSLLPEVSTPCSERSFSSRSEHATPSGGSGSRSSPLFSTPSSHSHSSNTSGNGIDPSLLTPTLSVHSSSLHHVTQISPLCFHSPSSSPSSTSSPSSSYNRGLLSLSLTMTPLQDDVEGEATISVTATSQPQSAQPTSEAQIATKKPVTEISVKKKRPLQSSISSSTEMAVTEEPPVKKRETAVVMARAKLPLGPTPKILRTVPSVAVLPSPPPHPFLSEFLRLKNSLLRSLPQTCALPLVSEQYNGLLLEQLRLRSLFYFDLLRDLQHLFETASASSLRGLCQEVLQRGVTRYRSLVEEEMRRQRMEVRILGYRKSLLEQQHEAEEREEEKPWGFLFPQMFSSLPSEILGLVASLTTAPPSPESTSAPISPSQSQAPLISHRSDSSAVLV